MIEGRDILLYLSKKYEGSWDKIFDAVKRKEIIKKELLSEYKANLKCNYVTLIDDAYPESIKQIYQPPFVLYYYGDLSLMNNYYSNLSVVGSRKAKQENEELTYKIISGLANDFVIVSGLAYGIDSIAHKAIIDAGGKTIAVLGCGIDYVYPKENISLYETIKKDHLVISEYPDDVAPKNENFPFRNRIITALSPLIFVPEVKLRSGTSASVSHAIAQNKDILVLPQRVDNNTINNRLIKDGAILVETSQDIIDEKK